eukprot:TRINITY_DN3625_c0_g1_i1.p1 TRINITY_DN3625_c0_g1~~TRINITY_DN3625_c0_g1_i1.p1  ORF type:complete len:128 (-),score=20.64 TRINITY_DN3625_c0_g1_i1:44-427(-)
MVHKIIVSEPSELAGAINTNKSANLFLLFTSTFEDGVRWCSDCIKADPHLDALLEKIPDALVIECQVDRAKYKGNPQHPYRIHKDIRLTAIPTLIHWKTKARLVEEECYDEERTATYFERDDIIHNS